MTDTTVLQYPLLASTLLLLGACSGSAIVGLPDVAANLPATDGGATDLGAADLGPRSDMPATDTPPMDAPPTDVSVTDTPPAPRAAWTIFVYGHGDHNLSSSLENDINKMTQAVFGANVHVVVAADFDARQAVQGATTPGALYSMADATARRTYPAGTTWYHVRSMMAPEVLRTDPEQDLDDAAVLTGAMNFAFERYPAEHYGVVMWDHGGSWDGGFGGDTQNGTRMPSSMRPSDAARAIRTALTMRGITGARPLDFLTFDTCLMATAEVIGEFESLTKVYIANAELDYGAGWNYAATFGYIAANPMASPQDIARQEVMHWDQLHATASLLDGLARSHVAVDMARVTAFNTAVGELTRLVITATDPVVSGRVARHGYRTLPTYMITLDSHEQPARKYRDMGQLLLAIAGDTMLPTPVRTAATTARTRLTEMILGSNQGIIRAATMQLGVHVGFPLPTTYSEAMGMVYRTNVPTWAMASDWDTMLRALRPSMFAPTPEVTASSASNTDNPSASARPSITFTAEGEMVEAGAIVLQLTSSTQFKVLEEIGRAEINDGVARSFTWDGQLTDLVGAPAAGPDAGALVHAEVTVSTVLPSTAVTPSMTAPAIVGIRGVCSSGGSFDCVLLCADMGARALAPVAFVIEASPGSKSVRPFSQIVASDPNITFAPAVRSLRAVVTDAGADPELVESHTLGVPIRVAGPDFRVSSIQAPAGSYLLFVEALDVYGREANTRTPVVTIRTPFGP